MEEPIINISLEEFDNELNRIFRDDISTQFRKLISYINSKYETHVPETGELEVIKRQLYNLFEMYGLNDLLFKVEWNSEKGLEVKGIREIDKLALKAIKKC